MSAGGNGSAGAACLPRVAVLDAGTGNLHSVARAVVRAGGEPVVTVDPREAAGTDALVLPGVGAFDACAGALRMCGLDEPVLAFAAAGRPVLGVCLGMQVLFDGSEEGDAPGLGLLPGVAVRLPGGPGAKVPHMGWNEVRWLRPHPLAAGVADGARMYFVHSYAVPLPSPAAVGAADHGMAFAAAVASGSVFATQFHPEKSGAAGLAIYDAFVAAARQALEMRAGGGP